MQETNTEGKTEHVINSIRAITGEYGLGDNVCGVSETIVEQLQHDSEVMRSHHPVEIALGSIAIAREQCSQNKPINPVPVDVNEINALDTPYEVDSLCVISTIKQRICSELNITPIEQTPLEQVQSLQDQFHEEHETVPSIVLDEAEHILLDIDSETVMGMHTRTVTAAALYAACLTTRTPMSQEAISTVMNVSENTIQNNYRNVLNAYSGHTIPEETVLNAHHFKLLKAIEQEQSC